MTAKYNNTFYIISFLIVLSFLFIFMFLALFKFTKKLPCEILKDQNDIYLIANEQIYNYLNNSKYKNKYNIEFENTKYYFSYNFLNKYNDFYIYETNLSLDVSKTNIAYFYLSNLNFFEYIK